MWLNEYHADFLSRDRLTEARRDAERRHLVAIARRRCRESRRPAAPSGMWGRLVRLVVGHARLPPRLL
jgi:hypothetical protein